MFKYLFLITIFPVFAFASITGTGKVCSGPSFDQYGDQITTRRDVAEKLADQDALRQCYPYQTHRVSEYRYSNTNRECQSTSPYAIKETVEADYTCAHLREVH
jgi:hypothetical protein